MKLSIVIPCYNEEKNIPTLLKRFSQCIQGSDVEVILVNNGSTDGSQKVIDALLPSYPFAKLVIVPVNQGYGYGIIQGLRECSGTYIGWTHADLQTDPSDVLKALSIIEHEKSQNLYIKGTRKRRPFFDLLFTWGMTIFETFYLRKWLHDINAQPNIFPKTFFEQWENPPSDFALDLYVFYQAKKKELHIIRFPVLFPKRIHGVSSWNTGIRAKWKFIKRTINFSVGLKRRL